MRKRSTAYLVEVAEQIHNTNALAANKIAFVPRFIAATALPISKQDTSQFFRRNGNRLLTIQPGYETGLPFGAMPRLMLCTITTLCKQNDSELVSLGPSASSFLRMLGKTATGGKNGSLTYAREQLSRLLGCTFHLANTDAPDDTISFRISEHTVLPTPEWRPLLMLSQGFLEYARRYAVPVDLRVLLACGHYPLAMDIYCWLTYRFYSLRRPVVIPWVELTWQFGSTFQREAHFRSSFRRALMRVSGFYPDARFYTDTQGLHLFTSPTHVSQK